MYMYMYNVCTKHHFLITNARLIIHVGQGSKCSSNVALIIKEAEYSYFTRIIECVAVTLKIRLIWHKT